MAPSLTSAHWGEVWQLLKYNLEALEIGFGLAEDAGLSDDLAGKVVGFLLLALLIFGGGSFLIAATGPDLITSFSASATSLGNVGPGLGELDHTGDFLAIPPLGRAIAMLQMLLGRLEIYPVILALSVVTLRVPRMSRAVRHHDESD